MDSIETIENTKNINGPLNVVRLEGEINGINKVLYVFFDWHKHLKRCTDLVNIDVDQYFVREFQKINNNDKIDKHYDLFLETRLLLQNGVTYWTVWLLRWYENEIHKVKRKNSQTRCKKKKLNMLVKRKKMTYAGCKNVVL